jgi:hypothetical protein
MDVLEILIRHNLFQHQQLATIPIDMKQQKPKLTTTAPQCWLLLPLPNQQRANLYMLTQSNIIEY